MSAMSGAILAEFMEQVQDSNRKAKEPTQEEKIREAINAILGELGKLGVQDDALNFEGEKWVIPAQYEGNVAAARDFLANWIKQQSQTFEFNKTFPYRPYDGAHAFMSVMKTLTGTTGFGVNRMTMFGPEPPEFISIRVAFNQSMQIPWGLVNFPAYNATFDLGYAQDEDLGYVFRLSVTAPRKERKYIEAIFNLIEEYLRNNSIYRGKAINGAGLEPDFIDLSTVNVDDVVYSQDVLRDLNANVWAPIRFADAMRAQRIPLKRAVLFAGPFGTGKTLGCLLTAKEAVDNNWTFIMCRTGVDDPATVLKTAKLYAPAVVVIEDLDVHAGTSTKVEISKLLEMLDGAVTKGEEIILLATTNHLKEIQKGALRPGRIDAVIEIKGLDEAGFRKLIMRTLGTEFVDPDIDWAAVAEAYEGFLPAFVVEATRRSQRYVMALNDGIPGIITTDDLVAAARTLRPQLDMMEGAKEGVRPNLLDDGVRELVENALGRTRLGPGHIFTVTPATALNGGKQ